MKFSTHVAFIKHILTAKYEIEIHVYSDVTPFYKILIRSTIIIIIIIYTIFYFYDVIPYDVTPFFYLLFTLFFVGKRREAVSRREIYRHNRFMYFVTTSSFVTSQIKKKKKKERKKLKCGTRIFRDNLNVSQKATQEKTWIFPCVGELALTRTIPCSKKRSLFEPVICRPSWVKKNKKRIKT